MTMDEVSQAIGQLQGRMDAHELRTARIETKLDEQGEKIDRVLAALEHQRGARKATAVAATGAGSVIGAILGWIVPWWLTRP